MASAPLGTIMKLVEPVSDGTSMNSTLIITSGAMATRMFLRKYWYAIAPKSAGTTFANAGWSTGLCSTGCSGTSSATPSASTTMVTSELVAIESVEMFCTDTCNTLILSREHCAFGYRESVFKHALRGRVVITAVTFRLSRRPRPDLGYGDLLRETEARGGATLRNIREAVCAIRRSKLPDTAVLGNAGSFFKNPVVEAPVAERLLAEYPDMPHYAAPEGRIKLAAGWLIDRAGMKGYREGSVGVHERQALVLVNHGGATGGEVIAFARTVQAKVREKFGIEIDTEVNIL